MTGPNRTITMGGNAREERRIAVAERTLADVQLDETIDPSDVPGG